MRITINVILVSVTMDNAVSFRNSSLNLDMIRMQLKYQICSLGYLLSGLGDVAFASETDTTTGTELNKVITAVKLFVCK